MNKKIIKDEDEVILVSMKDKYLLDYLKRLKKAKSDKEILLILDRVYEDGFYDGNIDNEPIPRL